MLTELLPQAHSAYRALPLLGRTLEAFDDWLIERGYRRLTRQCYIIRCKAIDSYFRRRRFHNLEDLTRERFRHCQRFLRKHSGITGTVGCLERFLRSKGKMRAPIASPATPFDPILASYEHYMRDVRGLAPTSIDLHNRTVVAFLRYLYRGPRKFHLVDLTPEHVDTFIRSIAGRFSRHTLSHAVASIQAFLRFLKLHDHVPSGREFVVYRPRLYKNEKLPRVLPWETVRTFLDGIDRDTFAGLRDYAMFLLIAIVLDEAVDVVIVCFPGTALAYPPIAAGLRAGKFVITPNKAAVAAHGMSLAPYTRGSGRRLWYSAAVGGALPALETLATLQSPVREIRGIVNGTCGVVLDAWAQGRTRRDAVALAQAGGFAEANPDRDLSGRDSADKLALLIEAAFGHWIDPEHIATDGIETIAGDPKGVKLIARATRTTHGVTARVAPESPPPGSFLDEARGSENRLEIELEAGDVIRLKGQGAGRWPTTVSVLGDLHEVARLVEATR
jgi:homoserine dehydrogenase